MIIWPPRSRAQPHTQRDPAGHDQADTHQDQNEDHHQPARQNHANTTTAAATAVQAST